MVRVLGLLYDLCRQPHRTMMCSNKVNQFSSPCSSAGCIANAVLCCPTVVVVRWSVDSGGVRLSFRKAFLTRSAACLTRRCGIDLCGHRFALPRLDANHIHLSIAAASVRTTCKWTANYMHAYIYEFSLVRHTGGISL